MMMEHLLYFSLQLSFSLHTNIFLSLLVLHQYLSTASSILSFYQTCQFILLSITPCALMLFYHTVLSLWSNQLPPTLLLHSLLIQFCWMINLSSNTFSIPSTMDQTLEELFCNGSDFCPIYTHPAHGIGEMFESTYLLMPIGFSLYSVQNPYEITWKY